MSRTIDVAATEGYLKFTIPLAGVGFAFAQTRLGTTKALYGISEVGGWSLPKIAMSVLLVLFFSSTVAGIFSISAIVGSKNDAAKFKALSANQRHAKLIKQTTKAGDRMASAHFWANSHLVSLIIGFFVAVVVFLGEALNPIERPETCQMRLFGAKIDFPCGGSLEDLYKKSSVVP